MLIANSKETDANYYSIADSKATFDKLKTTQPLTADEIKCAVINRTYTGNLYGCIGYTVLAVEDGDIAPSITHLIANGVT